MAFVQHQKISFNSSDGAFNETSALDVVGNFTTPTSTKTWTVAAVFSLLTCISGIIANGTLLFLFARDSALRTPFNIYLINLLLADFICVAIGYPMDLISNLNNLQWLLGNSICNLYLYNLSTVQAAIFHCHLLIAVNRIWAVLHPLSYRSVHSVRIAVLTCLGMWVYVNLAAGPELILDALFYRAAVETNGCYFNTVALHTYDTVAQLLFFHFPHLVMLIALAIVTRAKWKKHRARRIRNNVVVPSGLRRLPLSNVNGPSSNHTSADRTAGSQRPIASLRPNPKRESHGYRLLVLLTVSVTVCWTPIDIYFTLAGQLNNFDMPIFYQVSAVLFSFQTTMDPIIFTLAVKTLREALRNLFRFNCHAAHENQPCN
ncbi:hypothetical protein BV898_13032 [Hypsibius exemplaris]|uniref:G-protein coupled receptors family 1 profile domain-containing protein n=1 Tax=Hypsibius exemplaris TaxID=2072580 RepID=A0A1W0WBX3_HYPEX|nr:hypothetical protein BV898_13032 [Hypsibius exemplaris]